ncbi:MAG: replication/maintenance protein RepL [Aeromonas veronii]
MKESDTRRITQVDTSTGEEVGSFVAVVRPKQKSSFERHFTMNQAALLTIANELSHEQMRVLMALLTELDYENYIQVPQVDIAEKLAMQKANVSRAVKGLLDMAIILEGPKIGRSKTYRLNPEFGWKGTTKNHKKALQEGQKWDRSGTEVGQKWDRSGTEVGHLQGEAGGEKLGPVAPLSHRRDCLSRG